jgi:superfamily II RNA helicase
MTHKFIKILDGPCQTTLNDPALSFPYECDDFQKHSFECINRNENVLVTAHTGCGKTNVAKYAIAHFIKLGKKIIYTSPIKALSNQKYKEFREDFPDISVGIMTGDNKINPDADCVIMTTEILRNALYDKDSVLKDEFISNIGCVIFDEVHYINDRDRGKVWEETIIMLDPMITLVMLSATIDKAGDFANWIGTNKKKIVNLISTDKRVIPLEHFIYSDDKLYKILDKNNKFYDETFDIAKDVQSRVDKERKKPGKLYLINELVKFMKEQDLLQAIFFSFSRKNCEKYARMISVPLLTPEESIEVEHIFMKYMHEYDTEYRQIPQYQSIKDLMAKGIGFHHSGLLPILKEIVEILFQKGFIKVLFATETFAVGVNMPARSIIFSEIEKYTNGGRRLLESFEYKQMAGRAGRRGLDTYGTVILLPLFDFPFKEELKNVMLGKVPHISSKFYIDYSFILKIMQSSMDINGFIDKSLFNKDNLSTIIDDEEILLKLVNELSDMNYIEDNSLTDFITEYSKFDKMEGIIGIKLNQKQNKQKKKLISKLNNNPELQDKYNNYKKYTDLQYKINDTQYYIDQNKNYVNIECQKLQNVLIKHQYINDQDNNATMKGLISAKINECNPLILCEMVTGGIFDDLDAKEICAILAIFIDDGKSDDQKIIKNIYCSKTIQNKLYKLNDILADIILTEKENDVSCSEYGFWDIRYEYVDSIYRWASGISIRIIIEELNTYEGNFIRNVLKINNLVKEIINLTKLYGNLKIIPELEKIEDLIVRDIVTISSLYLS